MRATNTRAVVVNCRERRWHPRSGEPSSVGLSCSQGRREQFGSSPGESRCMSVCPAIEDGGHHRSPRIADSEFTVRTPRTVLLVVSTRRQYPGSSPACAFRGHRGTHRQPRRPGARDRSRPPGSACGWHAPRGPARRWRPKTRSPLTIFAAARVGNHDRQGPAGPRTTPAPTGTPQAAPCPHKPIPGSPAAHHLTNGVEGHQYLALG
jgi:hypothetical protein